MIGDIWKLNQRNRINFVMLDSDSLELPGIGSLTVLIAKNGSAPAPGAGQSSEIGNGWYSYLSTPSEADTIGPVSVIVTGAGAQQQNLEYIVEQRTSAAIPWAYTVTDSATGQPIVGVEVTVSLDAPGANVVWRGSTDSLGVARDTNGTLPLLDPGTYYFRKHLSGYQDDDNPDVEVVA